MSVVFCLGACIFGGYAEINKLHSLMCSHLAVKVCSQFECGECTCKYLCLREHTALMGNFVWILCVVRCHCHFERPAE